MSENLMRAWYLLHTKPRQEQVALENLQRQGWQCYLPQMRIERIRRGKLHLVTEPMFARYLFIQLESGEKAKSWAPIRSTIGVTGLVRFGAQAARVDDALVDAIRSREQAAPAKPMFTPGDSVTVTQGPFSGIEAIYQSPSADQRALILVQMLGKLVRMAIEPGQLRPRATDLG